MWDTLIWAVVAIAISGTFFYLVNNRAKELVGLRRSKQSLDEEEQRTELLERENAAKFDAATVGERAEYEQSRLLKEAAEARASAEVAEAPTTIAALQAEEERVIVARAEGRALAAKEQASREHNDPKVVETLVDAYKAFLDEGMSDQVVTFDQWLGNIDIGNLR